MRYKNEKDSCDVYVGMNALKPEAHTRTKEDILAIRHLYVDLDQDGSTSLAAIEKSNLVPPPSYVLNTSPDKYQVIWKVEDVQKAQAEPLLMRSLASSMATTRRQTRPGCFAFRDSPTKSTNKTFRSRSIPRPTLPTARVTSSSVPKQLTPIIDSRAA